MGISSSLYYKIERGQRACDPELLANALGVHANDLIKENGPVKEFDKFDVLRRIMFMDEKKLKMLDKLIDVVEEK
jgi:hypothetical protein